MDLFSQLLQGLSTNVATLVDGLKRLLVSPSGTGYLIQGALGAGQLTALVPHGLGRTYRGAWITGMSQSDAGLCVLTAPAAETLGYDVSRYVVVVTDINVSTVDNQLQLWVF